MTAGADALAGLLDALARRDLAGAAAGFAEHATYQEARRDPLRGRAAIAAHFARFAASGAAWRFEVDDVIAEADRACVLYRFGTPGGDGGSWRETAGCAVVRFDQHGHITEWREYER